MLEIEASKLKPRDVVMVNGRPWFIVQRVLKGRGRVEVITHQGVPVTLQGYELLTVKRR